MNSASNYTELVLRKEGSVHSVLDFSVAISTTNLRRSPSGSSTIYLNKGEYIDVRFGNGSGSATAIIDSSSQYNYIAIERIK
jgi:hypothetical protein